MYKKQPPDLSVRLSASNTRPDTPLAPGAIPATTDVMSDLLTNTGTAPGRGTYMTQCELAVHRKIQNYEHYSTEAEIAAPQAGLAMQLYWFDSALFEGLVPVYRQFQNTHLRQPLSRSYTAAHMAEQAGQCAAESYRYMQAPQLGLDDQVPPEVATRIFDVALGPAAASIDPVRKLTQLYAPWSSDPQKRSDYQHLYVISDKQLPREVLQAYQLGDQYVFGQVADRGSYSPLRDKTAIRDSMTQAGDAFAFMYANSPPFTRDIDRLDWPTRTRDLVKARFTGWFLDNFYDEIDGGLNAGPTVDLVATLPRVWEPHWPLPDAAPDNADIQNRLLSKRALRTADVTAAVTEALGFVHGNLSSVGDPMRVAPLRDFRPIIQSIENRLCTAPTSVLYNAQLQPYQADTQRELRSRSLNDFDTGSTTYGDRTMPCSLDVYGTNLAGDEVLPLYNINRMVCWSQEKQMQPVTDIEDIMRQAQTGLSSVKQRDRLLNNLLPSRSEIMNQQMHSRFVCAGSDQMSVGDFYGVCLTDLLAGGTQVDQPTAQFMRFVLLSGNMRNELPIHPAYYCQDMQQDSQFLDTTLRAGVINQWPGYVQQWRAAFIQAWMHEWINSVIWQHVLETCSYMNALVDPTSASKDVFLNTAVSMSRPGMAEVVAAVEMMASHRGTSAESTQSLYEMLAMMRHLGKVADLNEQDGLRLVRDVYMVVQKAIRKNRASPDDGSALPHPDLSAYYMLCNENFIQDHIKPSTEEVRLYIYWLMQMQLDQERMQLVLESTSIRLHAIQMDLCRVIRTLIVPPDLIVQVLTDWLLQHSMSATSNFDECDQHLEEFRRGLVLWLDVNGQDEAQESDAFEFLQTTYLMQQLPDFVQAALRNMHSIIRDMVQSYYDNVGEEEEQGNNKQPLVSLLEQVDLVVVGVDQRSRVRGFWRDMLCSEIDYRLYSSVDAKTVSARRLKPSLERWMSGYEWGSTLRDYLVAFRDDATSFVVRLTEQVSQRWAQLLYGCQKYIYTSPQDHLLTMTVAHDPADQQLTQFQTPGDCDGPRIWMQPRWYRRQAQYFLRNTRLQQLKRTKQDQLNSMARSLWAWGDVQRLMNLCINVKFACPLDSIEARVYWTVEGREVASKTFLVQQSQSDASAIAVYENSIMIDMNYRHNIISERHNPLNSTIVTIKSRNRKERHRDVIVKSNVRFVFPGGTQRPGTNITAETRFRVQYDSMAHMNLPEGTGGIHPMADQELTPQQKHEAQLLLLAKPHKRCVAYNSPGMTQEQLLHSVWTVAHPGLIYQNMNFKWACDIVVWMPAN